MRADLLIVSLGCQDEAGVHSEPNRLSNRLFGSTA